MSATSLTMQAFNKGAESALLNPDNKGQGRVSTYIGKPLRAAARLVYGIGVAALVPISGVIYHGLKALDAWIMTKEGENTGKAKAHLKAMGKDFLIATSILSLVALSYFFYSSAIQAATIHPASDQVAVAAGFTGIFGLGAALLPLLFAFKPDAVKSVE